MELPTDTSGHLEAVEPGQIESGRLADDGPGTADPLLGDMRRAGLLPLMVLHYVAREPCYGNQLIDRIAWLTAGTVAVNRKGRMIR